MQKVHLTVIWPGNEISQADLLRKCAQCIRQQPDEVLNLPSITIAEMTGKGVQVKINPINDEPV